MMRIEGNNKIIYVVRSHDQALFCWYDAVKREKLKCPAKLLHIDKHPDFTYCKDEVSKIRGLLEMDGEEAKRLLKNEITNFCFIIDAMAAGIIEHGLCISLEGQFDGELTKGRCGKTLDTYSFEQQKLFFHNTDDIESVFCSQGILGDKFYYQELNAWFKNQQDLILDIDLDFFTYTSGGYRTYAKNKKDIKRQISSESFRKLWAAAKVITIALEPGFCGSQEDCLEIVSCFQEIVFKSLSVDFEKRAKEIICSSREGSF